MTGTRHDETSQPDPAKSVRTLRVGEQVRHALAAALTRGVVKDDVLDRHMISVTEVRLTPDLRIATAYVMPLGGADTAAIIKALAEHAPRLRAEVAKAVRLKYAPDLRFRPDESFAEGQRIDELLRRPEVARDLGE